MGRFVVTLGTYAEDIALLGGALALSVGVGLAFGLAFALVAAGALSIAYGVWITPKKGR